MDASLVSPPVLLYSCCCFPCCISPGCFLMTNTMLLVFLTHRPHRLGHDEVLHHAAFEHGSRSLHGAPFLHVEPSHNSPCPHKGRQWPLRAPARLTSQHINLAQCKARQKSFGAEADHDDFLNCSHSSSTQYFIHQDKNSLEFCIYEKEVGMSWRRDLTQLAKSSWPWIGECPAVCVSHPHPPTRLLLWHRLPLPSYV